MAYRRMRGDRSFRRLLKQMPDAIKAEMVAMFEKTGEALLVAQKAAVPVRTGAVRNALTKRIYPSILKMRVGLIGKPVNRRLFYARIVEVGRKAKTVDVVRGGLTADVRAAGGRSNRYKRLAVLRKSPGSYTIDVKAMPARPFVLTPTTRQIRNTMGGQLNTYWDRVLKKAAMGASDA